eukprot:5377767-Amphidinium_carterae.2
MLWELSCDVLGVGLVSRKKMFGNQELLQCSLAWSQCFIRGEGRESVNRPASLNEEQWTFTR